jgi:putative PIN family toxin of toxin-antitoxin system
VKLVLDTDVIVAAFRSSTGGSAEILRLADQGKCRLAVSVALMLEYEAVLTRKEHIDAAGAGKSHAENFLRALAHLAEPIQIDYKWRPQTRDPNDDMVLETAINAGANAILTFNKQDFGQAPARFGITTDFPGEILEKMK